MKEKAAHNLQAAGVLMNAQFFDSVASRAYYAIYLAGWTWLAAHNELPPIDDEGRRYWPHASFADKLFEWGALGRLDDLDDFEYLRSRRVQADYFIDPVNYDEAKEALSIAMRLAGHLLEGNAHV